MSRQWRLGPLLAGHWMALIGCAATAAWALWSYGSGGVVAALMTATGDSQQSIEALRAMLARAGAFGPVVYVLAVVLEVVIAPLPGTLLYAPGGALFGGWWGGTLSLIGNVMGAMLATVLAARFGHRITSALEHSQLQNLAARVRSRGMLVVALLRVNPLTSSDLVSYAAGLVGLSPWTVGIGTFLGMAPLCYAQAYAAETLFSVLPGSGLVLIGLGAAYVAVVLWLIVRHLGAARSS